MVRLGFALTAAAAVLLAAGVAGATSSDPAGAKTKANDVSGVTVTAPERPNPLVNPASQFVRQHLPQNAYSEQYPRFRDDICVKVVGLPAEFDSFIAARMVELAHQVKAPVSSAADCTPNVNVIFTPKPQAQLSDIANRRDVLLGFRFHSQFKQIATFKPPIEAWYVTRTRDKSGEGFLEIDNSIPYNQPGGQKPSGRADSRLGNGLSAEVVHTLILADAKIGAIADYIAVLALARWQGLERCNVKVSTILNLLADGCEVEGPVDTATPADISLLAALYAVDARESGSQQRMAIAERMDAALKGASQPR